MKVGDYAIANAKEILAWSFYRKMELITTLNDWKL